MKNLKKDHYMRLFIGFSIPLLMSIVYDIVMNIFDYSDIIGIILGIIFLYIWYRYAKHLAKYDIAYNISLFSTHGFLILGSIITIVVVILYPNVPKVLELMMLITNYYVVVLQSLTSPLILILSYAFETEVYGLYLNLGCILALIAMMGVFTRGYDKYEEEIWKKDLN